MKTALLTATTIVLAAAGGYGIRAWNTPVETEVVVVPAATGNAPLAVVSEFAMAFSDTSTVWSTLAPFQDPDVGYYKQFTDNRGRFRMVAFFDPALLELRVAPTHMMRVTRDSLVDTWYTAGPHTPNVTEEIGHVIELYRLADGERYGRIEVVSIDLSDTTAIVCRDWEAQ